MAQPINTPAFAQYPRSYSVQVSAANTNGVTPTNMGLLWQAGPDGSLLAQIAVTTVLTAAGNQVAANVQFYMTPDGGTTYFAQPLACALATATISTTVAVPVTNVTKPDGTLLSPTNPLYLSGVTVNKGLVMTQSTLSNLPTYYDGGVSFGSANAQTLPFAQNSAGTLFVSSGVQNAIIDFEANFTQTVSTATLVVGQNSTAYQLVRPGLSPLSSGDITKGFRYRALLLSTGTTNAILLVTPRLLAATSVAQSVVVTAWGIDG